MVWFDGSHGFHLETVAGAIEEQSIFDFTCLDCAVSGVADGNHGFFVQQLANARIGNIYYKGLLETETGQTGTGFRASSANSSLVFKLTADTETYGFASSHNLAPTNTTQFMVKDGASPWQVSNLEFTDRSGTLNELRFRSSNSGTYGLHTDSSGGIIARRIDTTTDIFRITDTLIQPATDNAVSLGGPSLRWANTRTVNLDVASSFLPPASTTLPGSCAANREIFVDSDATPAGQQLYLCNSAGNGWNLIGDGGGGSGDAIEVEDGDNPGTFTAIDTTARFDDSGDVNFTFADGGAGGPDVVTATVRADSVALTTDTTGNYVDNVTGGAGIAVTHTPGEGSEPDVAVDLLAAEDSTGATSNNSGLEFGGAGSDKLALLQGCGDAQVLKWEETGGLWQCADDATGAGGRDSITVNATAATDANFNDTDPAAPAAGVNVEWQIDTTDTPDNISGYIQEASASQGGIVTTGTQTLAGAKTFTSDLRVDNGADAGLEIQIDSGNTTGQNAVLRYVDRGTSKFALYKNSSNGFQLTDDAAGTDRLAFSAAGSSFYNSGATTGDHIFRDSANTQRASILGDAATLCLGTAEDTCINRSAPGVYQLNATAGANPTADGAVAYDSTADRLEFGISGASHSVVSPSTTDTLTNKTLDVEATGNSITTGSKITLVAAGCNNATAGPGFDLPTSNAPAPACLGTSPHRLGSLDFSDGATQTAVTHFRLPGDWTGSVDVAFLFTGDTASSNNIRWQVSSACVADSEDLLSPTYNTASASNTAGPSTAGQRRSVSFSSVSMSNCAAGETDFWKFERVGGDAGDTYTGLARLLEVEITLRRAQ